jgi:hypothetical protein
MSASRSSRGTMSGESTDVEGPVSPGNGTGSFKLPVSQRAHHPLSLYRGGDGALDSVSSGFRSTQVRRRILEPAVERF